MAEFRFHDELQQFLAPAHRERVFRRAGAPHESLKHLVEALGVPHTEVGRVLLNGEPATLDRHALGEGDRIEVWPPRPALAASANRAAATFIADAHLGRLARYLRFAAYDTLFRNDWADATLVALAREQGRILLTRDRDLLMHREVRQGCHVHATEPLRQFGELARRLGLGLDGPRANRCLLCNAPLEAVTRDAVAAQLSPRTLAHFDAFWRCPDCARVFWRGSHWERLGAALRAQLAV